MPVKKPKQLVPNRKMAVTRAKEAGIKSISREATARNIYEAALCRETINNWRKILRNPATNPKTRHSTQVALKHELVRYLELRRKITKF